MDRSLDIVALRSLVGVADYGGFHRAADVLRVSQSAISQHVRRLEKVVGRPLVERRGRQAVFTADGLALLGEARRILAAHDGALRRLVGVEVPAVAVGVTEHAADVVLAAVTEALRAFRARVRFRVDRTARLADAVDRGTLDLAVCLTDAGGVSVGSLPLRWFSAPGWTPPEHGGWPVVAVEEPCMLRERALAALDARGVEPFVACDSGYVAGVVDAARAGLGLALLADAGPGPEGLVEVPGLPPITAVPLRLRSRRGVDPALGTAITRALRDALARPATA
ncbi:LysR family transcriptional regulator [Actinoplanes sp. NPDC049265]|uniref:LysR family transcriptional regulator n=1 Tax=Actinoplanes sp. NPDC049265 TaxID=3363902 RepID=UPI003712D9D1